MKVWLDDVRPVPDNSWIRTETAQQTIELLRTEQVEIVSLDHDLGLLEETGYDVIKWIERMVRSTTDYEPPEIRVHTDNPPARERMNAAIISILKFIRDDREEILV